MEEEKVETTTYLLNLRGKKRQKVTVPAAWKATFGPLVPGGRSGEIALRFYENKEKQRAVFTNVESFRDLSIPVVEEIENIQEEDLYKETPNGRKKFTVQAKHTKWRNPDEETKPEPEFTSLPKLEVDYNE